MSEQRFNTTCTMDCPDTCALEITVRDGKISRIAGAENGHPNTNGFICTKVSRFARRVYHRDRVLHPLRRTGAKGDGKFERISWEAAIAEIAERFSAIREKWGGEAILPYHYGGSNGLLGDELLDHYFFAKIGASRCVKTLCAAPTTAIAMEMYGKMPGVAFDDFPKATFILLWGVNPKVSHIHLMPYLRQARKNGAFIASVDPRNNFSDSEIDLHIPVLPGADLPLALGIIHFWQKNNLLDADFINKNAVNAQPLLDAAAEWSPEKAAKTAGISPEKLQLLAQTYAESTPALLRCGWGVERNANGGQAVAAILGMPALLGKFGIPGGGYTLSNSGAFKLDKAKILGDFEWHSREFNQTKLGELLNDSQLDPPAKALFVYNCNPVATVPDQQSVIRGLLRDDLFTVVHEQVMTDTALLADIVLPAVTFLEQWEIKRAYGAYAAGGVQPVIPACGEALPNEAVFAALGRALGFDDLPFQWDSQIWFEKVAAGLKFNGKPGQTPVFQQGKIQTVDFDGGNPVQFGNVFPRTADGKIQLLPPALGDAPFRYQPVRSDAHPLALISPANNKMISSSLGEFNYPTLFVTIHPDDAAARDIVNGDAVRVFNELGEVHCHAEISAAVRSGVVSMPKGAWRKSAINHATSTTLCPQTTNVVGGGACFNDARVEIAKLKMPV